MLNKFLLIGLTAISLAPGAALAGLQSTTTMAHATPMVVALKSAQGQFQTSAKPTQGTVQVKSIDGKQYLHLSSDFSTGNGPQVEVLLHKEAVPESYDSSNYVSLGEIKSFQGEQWYEIPEGVDVNSFKSVSIWCRDFDVTFGFAPIQG